MSRIDDLGDLRGMRVLVRSDLNVPLEADVITDDGRAALAEQQRQWATVTRALDDVWRGSGWLPTALAGT